MITAIFSVLCMCTKIDQYREEPCHLIYSKNQTTVVLSSENMPDISNIYLYRDKNEMIYKFKVNISSGQLQIKKNLYDLFKNEGLTAEYVYSDMTLLSKIFG